MQKGRYKPKLGGRRRWLRHLSLDKGCNSPEEEHKLNKRGYILYIPIKKKKVS
ncbi:MAG: hypothetical protein R2685_15630 [Candidatus Nitrosocosmicus sp.]|nr:hypothetical protein [Candidatus Nitrosocosmicus sp.]